jgi:hypothetical protein
VTGEQHADTVRRASAHIKRCDELFDGNVVRRDREFAYQQMRVLALEMLAENQRLRDALADILAAGSQPLDSLRPTGQQLRERGQRMMDIASASALEALRGGDAA